MIPVLVTPRLVLRPFRLEDAGDVRRLAGDPRIAATTLNVPHPYEPGMAERWIAGHASAWYENRGAAWAICAGPDAGAGAGYPAPPAGELLGAIALAFERSHRRAELGYWMGVAHWGRGYTSEAARAVVRWALGHGDLHRVHAHHFAGNEASGRVLRHAGLLFEGTLRDHVWKDGRFHDILAYGIIRADAPPSG